MTQDRGRLAASTARRHRRVAGVGVQGDQIRAVQDVGDALAAAIAGLHAGDALTEGMVRRTLRAWAGLPQRRLEVTPTELKCAGRVALSASGDAGRFLVCLCYAGVRSIALRAEAGVAQMQLLCEQLAALEAGRITPWRFARMAWRGELLGFDVVQVESVAELGEALVGDVDAKAMWAERSKRVVDVWTALATRAAQALSDEARAQRFGAPFSAYAQRALAGGLELSDQDVVALVEVADDPPSWAAAEVDLLRRHPSARAGVSPDQLAWVLSTYVEHAPRVDLQLLQLLSTLGVELRAAAAPQPEAGLARALLGAAFSRRLLSGAEIPPETWSALDTLAPDLRTALLSGTCSYGDAAATGPALLEALGRRYGGAALLAAVDPVRIGPLMASTTARVLLQLGTEPPLVLRLVQKMDAPSGLSALAAAPTLCGAAAGYVAELLGDDVRTVGLLSAFARSSPQAAACAGMALLAALGRGEELADLDELMATLVAVGHARDAVLPLWLRRSVRVGARRSALLALQTDPRLLSDAMRGVDPAQEPPEILELLEQLRWEEQQ